MENTSEKCQELSHKIILTYRKVTQITVIWGVQSKWCVLNPLKYTSKRVLQKEVKQTLMLREFTKT